MQSIGALSAGHQQYFSKLANPYYYLSGGEPEGHWFGKGAEVLGLKGKVTRHDLNELFRGYAHGRPLVQNAGKDDRQCGSDQCFSMPKSGSVAFALFPELREGIRRCQEDAVKYALSEEESTILFSRKGKGGREHVPAKMVAALYEHCCSRAEDPQLHTHCLVMNVGVQEDGTRALISKPLYDHKMRIGALYRSKLAELFEQRLGFRCKTVETWFEIDGIPKEVCDLFSTRRKEVVAKLGELGLESASAAAYATLGTRKAKTLVPPRAELFQRWQEQARGFDLDINNVIKNRPHNIQFTDDKSIAHIADTTLDSVSQTHRSLDDEKLIKERLHKIIADGVSNLSINALRNLEKEINNWEKNNFQLYDKNQQRLLVSKSDKRKLIHYVDAIQCRLSSFDWSILNVEQAIYKYSKPRAALRTQIDYELKQFKRAIQKKRAIKINRRRLPHQAKQYLSRQEADTVRAIVNNRGPLQVINTNDASRVNLCLRVCNEIWGKSNVDVWGFSLSRYGAAKLQEETGIRTRSFKTFELMRKPTATFRVKYAIKELTRQALFNHGYKLEPFKTKGKLLVVTNAHDLDSNQMNELLRAIKKYRGRVVLVGSADFLQGRTTPFDHVAYRASRNDRLQIRKDYLTFESKQTLTPENERKEP